MERHQDLTRLYFRFVLKRYREARNLTQEELSERIGVSTGFLGMMEIGRKWPNVDMLIRIARALGVRPGELCDALMEESEK
jgi:Predicted transcriptional regulators